MDRKDQLQALKVRAQEVQARLHLLNRRIHEIRIRSGTFFLKATVDSEKCVGCGICEALCPVRAIAVGDVVRVDEGRCMGCGYCIQGCPKGALSLQLVSFAYQGKEGRNV